MSVASWEWLSLNVMGAWLLSHWGQWGDKHHVPFFWAPNLSRQQLAKNFHDRNDRRKSEFAAAKSVTEKSRCTGFFKSSDLPNCYIVMWGPYAIPLYVFYVDIKPSKMYWSPILINMPLRRCFAFTVDIILVEEQWAWSFLAWSYMQEWHLSHSVCCQNLHIPHLLFSKTVEENNQWCSRASCSTFLSGPIKEIFFQEGARNTSGGGPGEHVVFFLWWSSLGYNTEHPQSLSRSSNTSLGFLCQGPRHPWDQLEPMANTLRTLSVTFSESCIRLTLDKMCLG